MSMLERHTNVRQQVFEAKIAKEMNAYLHPEGIFDTVMLYYGNVCGGCIGLKYYGDKGTCAKCARH